MKIKIIIQIAATAAFFAAYFLLYPSIGNGFIYFCMVPVALAGLFFGLPGGLISAVLVGPGLIALDFWTGRAAETPNNLINGLAGCLLLILVGWAMGRMNMLTGKVRSEMEEQARFDRTLKHLTSLLKAAVESTSASIAVTDLSGNILTSSQNIHAIWGLPSSALHEDASPLTMPDFAGKAQRPEEFNAFLQKIFQHPGISAGERFHLVDGRILEVQCRPHWLENQVVGLVWGFSDITDAVRSLDALESSEKTIRSLIDNSIDGILLLNQDDQIIEWNPGMRAITGLRREDVLAREYADVFYELMPLEDQLGLSADMTKSVLRTALQNTGIHEPPTEHRIRRTDGSIRVIETSVFAIHAEKGRMYGSISRDITERKAVERALIESHEVNQSILNAFPDVAYLIDQKYRVLAFNKAFMNMTGIPPTQITGSDLISHLDPQTAYIRRAAIADVFRTGQPGSIEDQAGEGYYQDTFQPIKDKVGKTVQVAVFSRDITSTLQRERELEAVASISSALRAALTPAEVYPIILDQLEILLKVEGIGLILKDVSTGDVRVEQARGAWTSLMNMRFSPEQATRGPVLIMTEPYLNNNIVVDSHLFQTRPFHGLVATACVPLAIGSEVIGTLWIGRSTRISKEELRVLSALGDITANAVHRARLYEQTCINAEQLATASELGRTLSETLSIHQIYERLSRSLVQLLPDIHTVIIMHYDPSARQTECVYALQNDTVIDADRLPTLPPGEGIQARAVDTREPVILAELEENPERAGAQAVLLDSSLPVRSLLCAPMLVKNEVLGLIQVQSSTSSRFTQADVRFLTLVGNTAAIAIQNAVLFENLHQSHENLTMAYEATLDGWARALDLRDHGTHGHTNRTVGLTVELGRRLGLSAEDLVNLRRGTQLHDIGKMGVPDSILLKRGPLTEEEWKVMRMHPLYAYQMLQSVPEFRTIQDVPYCHHEKWDGSGYPRGLAGQDIPMGARIFAVIDVWDALHSDRPYRDAWPQEKVLAYLRSQSGRQFDPRVVNEFFQMIADLPPNGDFPVPGA